MCAFEEIAPILQVVYQHAEILKSVYFFMGESEISGVSPTSPVVKANFLSVFHARG